MRKNTILQYALVYGAFISWAVGLHRQNREGELKDYIERENIEANINSLLKKAKKLNLKDKLAALVEAEIKKLPDVDIAELGHKIDKIVLQ